VLSDEEKEFLQASAAERLALGNEIVQYKKMMQLLDWANARRQSAIEQAKFTKDSCGYDWRLDTVTVRAQFAAWLETPEGQAVFKAGRLDTPLPSTTSETSSGNSGYTADLGFDLDPAVRGTCDRKRCKSHAGWYKLLMSAVRVLMKETASAAAAKLDAEEAMRQESEARYERRQLENNWVEVLSED
jgi:COMPASS component SPP1